MGFRAHRCDQPKPPRPSAVEAETCKLEFSISKVVGLKDNTSKFKSRLEMESRIFKVTLTYLTTLPVLCHERW